MATYGRHLANTVERSVLGDDAGCRYHYCGNLSKRRGDDFVSGVDAGGGDGDGVDNPADGKAVLDGDPASGDLRKARDIEVVTGQRLLSTGRTTSNTLGSKMNLCRCRARWSYNRQRPARSQCCTYYSFPVRTIARYNELYSACRRLTRGRYMHSYSCIKVKHIRNKHKTLQS